MKTTDTTMEFTNAELNELEVTFGLDAEYYEQNGQTFVVEFDDEGTVEAFAIGRSSYGSLVPVEPPKFEFNWESAEDFRDCAFYDHGSQS